MKRQIFIGLLLLLSACKSMNIDKVIEIVDNSDISALRGKSVFLRSMGRSFNTSIYYVYDVSIYNCAPYVVEVDRKSSKIIDISNNLLVKFNQIDYLQKEDIKQIMIAYFKLHVWVITVDIDGNIYINPSEQERPTLLKIANEEMVKRIEDYKYYKGNWYVRKE